MARQDDRQWVAAIGGAYRAGRVATEPEPARLLAVAHGLSVGDGREREPATSLELGSVQVERQLERHQVAVEIRAELACGLVEDGRATLGAYPAAVEQHRLQADAGGE